jgi:D-3-phosphoglycerate dehydrogenase / 2-oxoglutarate reductase
MSRTGNRVNIVILDDWDRAFSSSPRLLELRRLGDVTVYDDRAGTVEETIRRLEPADVAILIRERTPLDREMLSRLPRLRFIAQTGGGAAHIDKEALRDLGIGIAYTPGSSRQSVVELTFGLAIAALRDLPRHDRLMRRGEWPQEAGRTLRGKRLAIIGFGGIGSALVPAARVFGMDIIAWGRESSRERAAGLGVDFTPDLGDAIEAGDVVSVNLGLSSHTLGLIGAAELARLRPGSLLINTARGAIIDEAALVERLARGDVLAALDVFTDEPLPANHPLRSLENVILSPHVGWITDDNYENVVMQCIRNIETFLAGGSSSEAGSV